MTTDEQDAARYRWLRKHFHRLTVRSEVSIHDKIVIAGINHVKSTFDLHEPSVDVAVDNAMNLTP